MARILVYAVEGHGDSRRRAVEDLFVGEADEVTWTCLGEHDPAMNSLAMQARCRTLVYRLDRHDYGGCCLTIGYGAVRVAKRSIVSNYVDIQLGHTPMYSRYSRSVLRMQDHRTVPAMHSHVNSYGQA